MWNEKLEVVVVVEGWDGDGDIPSVPCSRVEIAKLGIM